MSPVADCLHVAREIFGVENASRQQALFSLCDAETQLEINLGGGKKTLFNTQEFGITKLLSLCSVRHKVA